MFSAILEGLSHIPVDISPDLILIENKYLEDSKIYIKTRSSTSGYDDFDHHRESPERLLDLAVGVLESCPLKYLSKVLSQLGLEVLYPDQGGTRVGKHITIGELLLGVVEIPEDRLVILIDHISYDPQTVVLHVMKDPRAELLVEVYGFNPTMVGEPHRTTLSHKISNIFNRFGTTKLLESSECEEVGSYPSK